MKCRLLIVIILVVFTITACGGKPAAQRQPQETSPPAGGSAASTTPVAKPGGTAKAVLAKAHEQALAWEPDARLQKVMTIYANQEGKVSTDAPAAIMFPWQFIYMSEKTKKAIIVDTNGKEAKVRDLESWYLFQPISEDFVDSSQAMAEAAHNGYVPGEGNNMELTLQWGPKKFTEPTWVIGQMGDTQYLVSGVTGKFVGKEAP